MTARATNGTLEAARPIGRPAFTPTAEQREMVKVMVAGGVQQSAIAGVLGISEPTLRKHFRHEIDNGTAQVAHLVVAAHIKRIQEGDMRAIEWWEKSRMGWSEKLTVDDSRERAQLKIVIELLGDPTPAPVTIEHERQDRRGFDSVRPHVGLVG